MKGGGGGGAETRVPGETPGDELQKMPHTKASRFKPKARLEPAQQHWWQARKADVLTVTPGVAAYRTVHTPQTTPCHATTSHLSCTGRYHQKVWSTWRSHHTALPSCRFRPLHELACRCCLERSSLACTDTRRIGSTLRCPHTVVHIRIVVY